MPAPAEWPKNATANRSARHGDFFRPPRFLAPRMNEQFPGSSRISNDFRAQLSATSMKPFRHIISFVCVFTSLVANAGEQLTANDKGAQNQPTAAALQLLQGAWEGVLVGDDAHQKITITIKGNSLHFHRDANFWFETTITLPAGKDPKQLHATIKDCPPPADSIGEVVRTFFKIEDGTLTLATM